MALTPNARSHVTVTAAMVAPTVAPLTSQAETWPVLLPEVKLKPDHVHHFAGDLLDIGPIRFVRLNIYPDGGVSRLRLMGKVVR